MINKIKQLGVHLNEKNGSVRHCQLVRFALENFGRDTNDIVGIMEGDIFLIRDFSIREYMQDHDLIGTVQHDRKNKGLEYIWIGLSFFNLKKLPNPMALNFDLTYANGTLLDSGGNTYWYLKDNPKVRVKKYSRIPLSALPRESSERLHELGFSQKKISFLIKTLSCPECNHEEPFLAVEFHIDHHFLHFASGRYSQPSDDKSILFKDFLDDILIS
ncbi:MAG: hypothetical protein WC365_01950 [Candidatus Babeliales bacterium]